MRMIDELGPLARAAFNDTPRNLNVRGVLEQFKRDRREAWFRHQDLQACPPLNWLDPATDKALADHVDRGVAANMGGKDIAWHLLKPKRPPKLDLLTRRMMRRANGPAAAVELRAIEQLTPYASNPRTHSPEQVEQIVASIREFGWTIPVLCDESGTIIAGHGRVMAADKLRLRQVPVMVARGWSDAQKRAYVIADNQIPQNAGWDAELLRVEVGELRKLDFDVSLLGFTDLQLVEFDAGLPGSGGGVGGAGEHDPATERELTQAEEEVYVQAWAVLQDEWSDLLETFEQRGIISTSFTKGALAVHFMRARLYGTDIPSAATLAYTPHRVRVAAANSGSFIDMMKDRSAIRGIRFLTQNQPRFDKMLGMTLAVNARRLPGEFPAGLARNLFDEFVTKPGGRALDPCHGWGGRMLGFLLSRNVEHYEGFDPDGATYRGVSSMFKDLKRFAVGKRTVRTSCTPYEDAKVVADSFDFALTSPPYFNVERYDGELSSWRRFDTFDKWVEGFYLPLIVKTAAALKVGATFALQIGNQSYPLEDVARKLADQCGLDYVETRASGMINNFNKTEQSDGEVIVLLRKSTKKGAPEGAPVAVKR